MFLYIVQYYLVFIYEQYYLVGKLRRRVFLICYTTIHPKVIVLVSKL